MADEQRSIRFQADDLAPVTIPASATECVRYFEYLLLHRNRWLLAKDIASALRTIEVHARLHDLKHRYRVPIETKPGPGQQKLYRLYSSVKVLEAVDDG